MFVNTRKDKDKKQTIEDIKWVQLDMPDGTQETACTAKEAAIYLDVTPSAFTAIRQKNKFVLYELGYGSVKYVLKKDLDELKRARPAKD